MRVSATEDRLAVGNISPQRDQTSEVNVSEGHGVKASGGFVAHASIYCIVITDLVLLNAVIVIGSGAWRTASLGREWWCIWPALGWGIGLAIHGAVVHWFGTKSRHFH